MTDALKQALDDLKGKRVKYYTILNYTLDSARANEPLFIAGAYIYVLNLDGTAKIKLNEISGDDIDLFKYRQIASPFYRIFITHMAQASKVLSLAIGVSSENFSISDFQSPDLGLLSGYAQELRDSHSYLYGTPISKSNSNTTMTPLIVHTVTAGKTLLLESFTFFVNGSTVGSLEVRDASDVTKYKIVNMISAAATQNLSGNALLPIPEGYDVCLCNSAGDGNVIGWIQGREV